jgi:hypothetical protein
VGKPGRKGSGKREEKLGGKKERRNRGGANKGREGTGRGENKVNNSKQCKTKLNNLHPLDYCLICRLVACTLFI